MKWNSYRAALFDLDGVLTPTTDLHMRAWSQMFNDYLRGREDAEPYTDSDYFSYVDGKPRYEGVASFLASRSIVLPQGDASDRPEVESICGLGNRKNQYFNEVLARDGIEPYPGSLRLLDHLAGIGLPMAVVSSSRNAREVLEAAGLTDYFEVVMDGNLARQLGLPGKPEPDVFVESAKMLDVAVDDTVVLEDALSGVASGAAGGFGLVVGIDRGAGAEALKSAGADLVVTDCEELLA
ncbi:MAG: HAD-IA family hydrolase [Propionibacterium sp.]|nr:HAD-IA family hydrolase [Propionibacterium sp.]